MYKCAKTLMYLAFFTAIPLLLSACGGGASTDDAPSQPSSVINKPEPSSISSSTEALALPSSSLASSSSAPSSTARSSERSYLRSSRASSSINSQSSISIDVTPPTSTKLQLYRLSENSITLIWDDATDDAGISHYEISRNGVFIARVDYPSYMLLDQGLASYTSYNYSITAFDLAGNESGSPQIFTIRTLATSGGRSSRSSLDTFNSSMANNSSKFDNNLSSSDSNASSKANVSSNSNTSSKASVSSNSNASSKASLSSKSNTASSTSSISSNAEQTVTITWSHPNQRE
ncbi:MAG: processive endocellulase, partial [Cellvibrio sp.]|nr:processive endocellulase [Cellvibrio sp.]